MPKPNDQTQQDPEQQEPPQGDQTQQDPEQQEPPQGGPDVQKAYEAAKAKRDEYKAQVEELQKAIEGLKGNEEEVKALKAEIEKQKADAAEAAKKAEFSRVNSARLATAGCVDIELALTLLDENGDVDALKEKKPYLFQKQKPSGLKPAGGGNSNEADERIKNAFRPR